MPQPTYMLAGTLAESGFRVMSRHTKGLTPSDRNRLLDEILDECWVTAHCLGFLELLVGEPSRVLVAA